MPLKALLLLFQVFIITASCLAQNIFGSEMINRQQNKLYREPNILATNPYDYIIYESLKNDSCSEKKFTVDSNKRKFIIDSLSKAGFADNDIALITLKEQSKLIITLTRFDFYKITSTPGKQDSMFIFDIDYSIKLKKQKITRQFSLKNITTTFNRTALTKRLNSFKDYDIYKYDGINIYRLGLYLDSMEHAVIKSPVKMETYPDVENFF